MGPDLSHARAVRVRIAIHREIHADVDTQFLETRPSPFLQTILGFSRTNLGLSLLVEAVTDESGALRPTLSGLLRSKSCHTEHTRALERFSRDVLASSIVAADINPNNLVFVHSIFGQSRFVLVDGLGDKTINPMGSLFASWNYHPKRRRIARLWRHVAECEAS